MSWLSSAPFSIPAIQEVSILVFVDRFCNGYGTVMPRVRAELEESPTNQQTRDLGLLSPPDSGIRWCVSMKNSASGRWLPWKAEQLLRETPANDGLKPLCELCFSWRQWISLRLIEMSAQALEPLLEEQACGRSLKSQCDR